MRIKSYWQQIYKVILQKGCASFIFLLDSFLFISGFLIIVFNSMYMYLQFYINFDLVVGVSEG